MIFELNRMLQRAAVAAAPLLALCLVPAPAAAQSSIDNPSGMNNPNSIQPKPRTLENAPQALPGAAAPAPQTAPTLAAPSSGDPNIALFNAINSNDYNAAQDAVSRGADLDAENPLGETPLDLSVALNRNSITFMLLSARNESGGDDTVGPQSGPVTAGAARSMAAPAAPMPAAMHAPRHGAIHHTHAPASFAIAAPSSVPGDNPGTPNAAAGFLGFGAKE